VLTPMPPNKALQPTSLSALCAARAAAELGRWHQKTRQDTQPAALAQTVMRDV